MAEIHRIGLPAMGQWRPKSFAVPPGYCAKFADAPCHENLADCVLQRATDIMHDRKQDLSREDGKSQ
jgi:hypothetical protein